MYLFNNVELPALPERDAEAYPHAVIYDIAGSRHLRYLDTVAYVNSSDNLVAAYPVVVSKYSIYADESVGPTDQWTHTGDEVMEDGLTTVWSITASASTRVIWANFDILHEDGTVFLAASEPFPVSEPVSTKTLDRTSMLLGWLAGRQMAICRSNSSNNKWCNLLDLSGEYTSNGYSAKYVSDSSTTYTEFAAGEHPLNWTCENSYAADSEAVVVNSHIDYALSLSAGDEVRFEITFPTVQYTGVEYEYQRINFLISPPPFVMTSFSLLYYPNSTTPPEINSDDIFESYSLDYVSGEDGQPTGFVLNGTLASEMYAFKIYYCAVNMANAKPFTCTTEVTYKSYNDIRYQIKEVEQ